MVAKIEPTTDNILYFGRSSIKATLIKILFAEQQKKLLNQNVWMEIENAPRSLMHKYNSCVVHDLSLCGTRTLERAFLGWALRT